MKKYKLWWLVCASVSGFIWFNWVLFALTGLNFIRSSSVDQGFTQILVCVISSVFTFIPLIDGSHKESK